MEPAESAEPLVVTLEQITVVGDRVCLVDTTTPVTGLLVEYHANGQRSSEITLEEGLRLGPYVLWYDNGCKRSETMLLEGVECGAHTEWYSQGHLRVMTYFMNGVECGAHTEWHLNGRRAVIAFYENGHLSRLQRWDESGHPIQVPGWMLDGTPEPKATVHADLPQPSTTVQTSRVVYASQLVKMDNAGKMIDTDQPGLWWILGDEAPFTGKVVWTIADHGIAKEANFLRGELHGLKTEWYQDGAKKFEARYETSKLHGLSLHWWLAGRLQSETRYQQGRRHGLARSWYPDGQMHTQATYENGKPHGFAILHHPNGQRVEERVWNHGHLQAWRQWRENGSPVDLTAMGWDAQGRPLGQFDATTQDETTPSQLSGSEPPL